MAIDVAESRELKERVVEINRVAKVVKGGRRFSFTALVVIGDEVDRVGVGYGKAREVPLAISKAVDDAKKNLFTVPKHGTTITHEILGGSTPRACCCAPRAREPASSPAAASAPCSSSPASATSSRRASARRTRSTCCKATVNGLQSLRRPEDVAQDARPARSATCCRCRSGPSEEPERGAGRAAEAGRRAEAAEAPRPRPEPRRGGAPRAEEPARAPRRPSSSRAGVEAACRASRRRATSRSRGRDAGRRRPRAAVATSRRPTPARPRRRRRPTDGAEA